MIAIIGMLFVVMGVIICVAPEFILDISYDLGINLVDPTYTWFGEPLMWSHRAVKATMLMGVCTILLGTILITMQFVKRTK